MSVPQPLLHGLYRTMLRIRLAEEAIADLVEGQRVHTPCHLYIGQEAIAAGVCAALETKDVVWGTHRSHGHYLAKGGDLRAMMAEIMGKATGCSHGRGGSMHLLAQDVGILGTVPIVAGTIPLAVGAGLAAKIKKSGQVSVSFFGDGAMEEGHFHESMNMAAVYRLPVIFACENNFYSSHLPLLQRRVEDNLYKAGEFHGMPSERLDGNDAVAVFEATERAVQRARSGQGPTFLEFRTYRWRGHVGASWDEDVGVKRKDELGEWLAKDPILRVKNLLLASGTTEASLEDTATQTKRQVREALDAAESAPVPSPDEIMRHVFVTKSGAA